MFFVLGAAAVVLIFQLFIPPVIGLADQSDIVGPRAGSWPCLSGARTEAYVLEDAAGASERGELRGVVWLSALVRA
jgi:hypothetical protein